MIKNDYNLFRIGKSMSALVDKIYTFGNLMTFDENGLSIASYVDIKRTLINRKRELYGIDIDVSDASADGQWLSEIALLINNAFQAFNELYSDLNPATAQGKALDLLASFSNIARKPATASTCEVELDFDDSNPLVLRANTKFIDKNNLIWSIDTNRSAYLSDYEFTSKPAILPLICDTVGPIEIPAGLIVGFVNIDAMTSNVIVTQPNPGIRGTIEESDAHLRARRNNSAANEAVTIIDGIQGALLANANVVDAIVINHPVADNNIPAHTIEAIIRTPYWNDADLVSFIGNTIYNRLTPGIPAVYDPDSSDDDGSTANKQMTFTRQIGTFTNVVEWVYAKPIMPQIYILLHALANCDKDQAAANIIEAVAAYANDLGLLKDMEVSALLQEIIYADPKFQGRATYYCVPVEITVDSNQFVERLADIEAASHDPTIISAQLHKTYYSYDNECHSMAADTYRNNAKTIVVEFR